ncbi:hypothetical protein C500_15700 [Natrialba magadii ATCC 43099]|uniref:Uncharacterized protein n=1 Tax=Natrialba magadii (strain ATCC 43099 / DSM 3394 / CCM 3739 / CIP 104546 / IAM 13178 / JCM 8861 / NBRC 102185 / NCIMB 2190 / MS3) TaxID=547559 RepID=L9UP22_NATMM|nr:hypothetical protein C500_15700 [Natrialba magadii ATCC 43099]
MPESVVGLALDRFAEDFVGFLDGDELRLCAVVVVQIWVVDADLLPIGIFDLLLGGVGWKLEKVVEILSHKRSRAYCLRCRCAGTVIISVFSLFQHVGTRISARTAVSKANETR